MERVAAAYEAELVWRPFLLGAVFKLTNTLPLIDQPFKGEYFLRDVPRTARRYGVPSACRRASPSAR